jgi:hypothetical protein
MDDFEQAVHLLYDPSASSDSKDRAFQFVEDLKQSPQASWFCAQNFFNDVYADATVRFACLQVRSIPDL